MHPLVVSSSFVVLTAALTACGAESTPASPDPAPIAALEIGGADSPYSVLQSGQTLQLTVRAFDRARRLVDESGFSWLSSNPAAATVDSRGLVTAVAEGVAKITVVIDSLSADQPVVVDRSGTGVHLDCEATLDVEAASARLEPAWSTNPFVRFDLTTPSSRLRFAFEPWVGGRVCLILYPSEDLNMRFPGGASFLSFDVHAGGDFGTGWIGNAEVSYGDGSSEDVSITGVPRAEGPGFRAGTLATLDLTDRTRVIEEVRVQSFQIIYVGNLRFFSGTPPVSSLSSQPRGKAPIP